MSWEKWFYFYQTHDAIVIDNSNIIQIKKSESLLKAVKFFLTRIKSGFYTRYQIYSL